MALFRKALTATVAGAVSGALVAGAGLLATTNASAARGTATYVNAYGPYQDGATPIENMRISGCRIVFSGKDLQPRIAATETQPCVGVRDVDTDYLGRLRVSHDAGGPVVFAFADTGTVLGGTRGITVGASGGSGGTVYEFYDTHHGKRLDIRSKKDRKRLSGKGTEVTVGWVNNPGREAAAGGGN